MVCKVNCAAIMGVDVLPVIVETDIYVMVCHLLIW